MNREFVGFPIFDRGCLNRPFSFRLNAKLKVPPNYSLGLK